MIEAARKMLSQATRIVSFSGAGLSAESGVSTFRDPQGLWSKYDPMRLASPDGFADDPQTVNAWYASRRQDLWQARPNPAHHALAARTDIIHVTQNVDDLLERAGATDVLHLHGTIGKDRCHGPCGHEEHIDLAEPPGLRDCPDCGAPMRPAVVWFGEALPTDTWQRAERACQECDVLLVIGTSAVVYPAAGLIDVAQSHGARVVIVNIESSEASGLAHIELLGKAGEIVPSLL